VGFALRGGEDFGRCGVRSGLATESGMEL